MSPTIAVTNMTHDVSQVQPPYQKGVKHLYESGISKVPDKYIFPLQDRPESVNVRTHKLVASVAKGKINNLKLPVIDFAELQSPATRPQVLKFLAKACQQYGFFQVVNHGISSEVISNMIEVSTRFFELPFEERAKYMSSDMKSAVRYGTSFNQNKDKVFCWRDFLKLLCNPLSDVLAHWPSSPVDFRNLAATYAKETKHLFLMLMEAILDSLLGNNVGTTKHHKKTEDQGLEMMKKFQDGSQLMVVNCYPPCPQPDLTLGMPPHSDYGFLTLLLQDAVEGLQIQFQDKWVTVDPIPGSFVVNVGDHLEIFSNGIYKSVLHRVLVNSTRSRISVASLHSLSFECMVSPWSKLIDDANPRRYKDTDFASHLEYISSSEHKKKNFLESRKLT